MRFGAEKAIANFDGAPMVLRGMRVLGAGCARVAINAPAGSGAARLAAQINAPHLIDPPDAAAGPLAGVLAGLDWAQRQGAAWLATAPCDTPNLPNDLVGRLLERLEATAGARAATVRTADGLQPLCTLWGVAARGKVAAALAGGAHPPVRKVLSALRAVEVTFDLGGAFANVNTPHDLSALAR